MAAAAIPLLVKAAPWIATGLSALGGLFGNRASANKASEDITQTSTADQMPEYDPNQLYMRNLLMDQFMDRLRFNDDFFQGYKNEGLKNINAGSDAVNRNIENILAARGLGNTTAGASSVVSNALNTVNQQNSFLNSIPLLQDQRNKENLAAAGGFFSQLPYGLSKSGTTTTKGIKQGGSSPLGGLLGNLGITLAGLWGQGAFGGGNSGNTGGTFSPNNVGSVNTQIVPPNYKIP